MSTNDDIKTIREALDEAIAIDKRDNFGDPSLYTNQLENAIAAIDRLEAQQRDIAKLVEAGDAMHDELRANDAGNGSSVKGRMEMYQAWDAAKSAAPKQQSKAQPWPDPKWQVMRYEGSVMPDGRCAENRTFVGATESMTTVHLDGDTMWARAQTAPQQPKRLTDEEIERIATMDYPAWRSHDLQMIAAEAARNALRYARDHGYLGGLSVDEAMDVMEDLAEDMTDMHMGGHVVKLNDYRARLTAKLGQQ